MGRKRYCGDVCIAVVRVVDVRRGRAQHGVLLFLLFVAFLFSETRRRVSVRAGRRQPAPFAVEFEDLVNDVLDGRKFSGEVRVRAFVRDCPGSNSGHLAFGVTLHIRPLLDDLNDFALAFPDLVDGGRDLRPRALLYRRRYAPVELAYGNHTSTSTQEPPRHSDGESNGARRLRGGYRKATLTASGERTDKATVINGDEFDTVPSESFTPFNFVTFCFAKMLKC